MSQENQSTLSDITNSIQEGYDSARNTFEDTKESISDSLNTFSDNVGAPAAFMDSNTLVAKFSFLILIIIIFIVLFRIGVALILYFSSPSKSPYVIKGLLGGNDSNTISQDPNISDSVLINRSNNQSKGAEFSWSIWLYLSDIDVKNAEKYQHVFNKGTDDWDPTTGKAMTNNAPGMYIGPNSNNLHITMDTMQTGDAATTIDIDNIPLKKWFHVVLRLQNNTLDVYINGTVSDRLILNHTPKQNFQDIYINQNNGFNGQMSDLRYFDRALNVFEINSILNNGPNLMSSSLSSSADSGFYGYLSNMWYTSKV
jgi:hypothetical protein